MLKLLLQKTKSGDIKKDIHLIDFDNIKILLDVNSSSVSIIDNVTFEVLTAIIKSGGDEKLFFQEVSQIQPQKMEEIMNELKVLYEEGCFLSADRYSEYTNSIGEPVLKSLCLHVSHDCNLRCKYCFAGTGNFGGERMNMPLEVGKRALDFLLENSRDRKFCEVDFFGGEPLLNFEVVKKLVAYGKKRAAEKGKIFRFTLTTNGVLLNQDVQEYLNREGISVVLSLDGRKEINDAMRPFPNGSGSYDIIVQRFKQFVASRDDKNYYLRGTFTRKNLDFYKDVSHMFDLGFKIVSVEPVVAPPSTEFAFKEEDKPRIKEEYRLLARDFLKRKIKEEDIQFFHFNIDLEDGPCLPKRLTSCGAGFQYLAVTPEGRLFPCHQFVGNDEYLLGDIWESIKNKKIPQEFKNAHIYNKECKSCWARFLCSGGCHASAVYQSGDIRKPYSMGCFMQKVRLECAVYIYVMERLIREEDRYGKEYLSS